MKSGRGSVSKKWWTVVVTSSYSMTRTIWSSINRNRCRTAQWSSFSRNRCRTAQWNKSSHKKFHDPSESDDVEEESDEDDQEARDQCQTEEVQWRLGETEEQT